MTKCSQTVAFDTAGHGSLWWHCADISNCSARQAYDCLGFPLPYAWGADDFQLYADGHGKAHPHLQALFADLCGKQTECDLL